MNELAHALNWLPIAAGTELALKTILNKTSSDPLQTRIAQRGRPVGLELFEEIPRDSADRLRGFYATATSKAYRELRQPLFAQGDTVRHTRFNYQATVLAVDPVKMATESWHNVWQAAWHTENSDSRALRDQPWYRLKVDLGQQVSQRPTQHPTLSRLAWKPLVESSEKPMSQNPFYDSSHLTLNERRSTFKLAHVCAYSMRRPGLLQGSANKKRKYGPRCNISENWIEKGWLEKRLLPDVQLETTHRSRECLKESWESRYREADLLAIAKRRQVLDGNNACIAAVDGCVDGIHRLTAEMLHKFDESQRVVQALVKVLRSEELSDDRSLHCSELLIECEKPVIAMWDAWLYVCIFVRMYASIHLCMFVCLHVCMCVSICV